MQTREPAEIDPKDLNFRWVDGYYDGLLSGFAIWQGRLCYFEICDASAPVRKFSVHSLSENEAKDAIGANEKFKAVYGDHNDLHPDGSRAGGTCRMSLDDLAAAGDVIAAEVEAKLKHPPAAYGLNPVVGWFTSSTF